MNTEDVNKAIIEKKKDTKDILKKVGKAFLIILFNIIFPYIIYTISNINNEKFFLFREIKMEYGIFINFAFFMN